MKPADPLDRATTSPRRITASIWASRGGIGGQVAAASLQGVARTPEFDFDEAPLAVVASEAAQPLATGRPMPEGTKTDPLHGPSYQQTIPIFGPSAPLILEDAPIILDRDWAASWPFDPVATLRPRRVELVEFGRPSAVQTAKALEYDTMPS